MEDEKNFKYLEILFLVLQSRACDQKQLKLNTQKK